MRRWLTLKGTLDGIVGAAFDQRFVSHILRTTSCLRLLFSHIYHMANRGSVENPDLHPLALPVLSLEVACARNRRYDISSL